MSHYKWANFEERYPESYAYLLQDLEQYLKEKKHQQKNKEKGADEETHFSAP